MKYHILLILIILFWAVLAGSLTLISKDTVLETIYVESSYNTSLINHSGYFNTSDSLNPTASSGGFLKMTLQMFTFTIPSYMLPTALNAVISFINWVLLLLLVICIYRIANPLS